MIPKHYYFQDTEKNIYQFWLDNGYFASRYDKAGQLNRQGQSGAPFVMVIPPPNVTGRLHMGHALNNTIQDLLIRFYRMRGRDVLWIPGTDHAGIATQTVVKKMLDEQGVDYRNLDREEFIQHVWNWKNKFGDIILGQLRSLGISCDWDRVSYTMDPSLSRAVVYAFKKLYDAGYIYRAQRIVNWCPIDKTALSDDEVETSDEGEPGFLYDIAYPLVGEEGELIVSTTRPETLFGDVAVAVNSQDKRFNHLTKNRVKKVKVPLTDREVPIITDDYVDPKFGTGCLKVTPAHDPHDFEIGIKHNLPIINIMNEDASLNENVPAIYQGLSREAARKQVVINLETLGFFRGKKHRMIPVGRSYRSKALIEYRLSDQWFVKMHPLAEKVLLQKGLHIYPKNYEKLWSHWLTNIRDWCISRQILWGHRIPAWFHRETGEVLVKEEEPEEVKQFPDKWYQDDDVLDTWFSSALWPMSVMGWPEDTSDFRGYFPTTALSTAKDIIFFWVARMCLMSLFFENRLPFSHVYFHPTVMDHRGKIMSKSKGNGLDPKHIIEGATVDELKAPVLDARPKEMKIMLQEIEEKYPKGFIGVGADALRYTLIFLSSHMQSLQLSMDNFLELGRRFTDKLWNASRLIFLHLEKAPKDLSTITTVGDYSRQTEDIWLETRCWNATQEIVASLEKYDFSSLGKIYYVLIWNDFCDWYLESIKFRLDSNNSSSGNLNALNNLIALFEKILIILHPLIPFLTEELYQNLRKWSKERGLKLRGYSALIITPFLGEQDFTCLKKSGTEMGVKSYQIIQTVVNALRSFKKENDYKDRDPLKVYYSGNEEVFAKEKSLIIHLSYLKSFYPYSEYKGKEQLFKIVESDFVLYVEQVEKDKSKILTKIDHKLKQLEKDQDFIEKRLANQGFVKHARSEIIKKEMTRLKKIKNGIQELLKEKDKYDKS